ncbi:Maf family protein [Ferroacidibacillus organovorans]|uniref:dTTP/UTP pyrophosphatase n=1 Tax=Ferroacidibacillus organovorans TaxID=1765683 RepID=A0A101XSJ0_9BACL|nr:Maf family protein [Ferroacidibacillus organovorans]KUO96743.1 hypothetical protein ATW55_07940 [Ferroacidibacillus organovorans]
MNRILLASTSPRRTQLLTQIGIAHEAVAPDYEEEHTAKLPPHELVMKLACEKALSVARIYSNSIVLGADTLVYDGDQPLGKPASVEEAKAMLRRLAGKTHDVYTGVALVQADTMRCEMDYRHVRVTMRMLRDEEIAWYVNTGEPMDKAGAYSIQGIGAPFITEIHGDFYAVVGLPLSLTVDLFARLEISNLPLQGGNAE